jgi:hypothetical protein
MKDRLLRSVTVKSLLAVSLLAAGLRTCLQAAEPLYRNDFQSATVDQLPDDLLVLDGDFLVKEDQGNRFLELPGAPLESFGLLFGPTEQANVAASARFYGTSRGRRSPTFAVGVNGSAGFRLQVSPAKQSLELYRGETLKMSCPYAWQSSKWTHLKLQIRKLGATLRLEGKAWIDGSAEPDQWLLTFEDKEEVPPGRSGIFGSPFAGTPIRFDDLLVTPIAP